MFTRFTHRGYKGAHSPFVDRGISAVHHETTQWQEGIVVDRVVNDNHSEYAEDGYNVGCVKFRLIKSNQYRDESTLNWAWPIEANISQYPLLNEIVVIVSYLNRFYYTRKLNAAVRVTTQALFGLNEELSPIESTTEKVSTFNASIANPTQAHTTSPGILGKYFLEPTPRIYRLRHDEGDVIYEGRGGHSIRFGHSWIGRDDTQFIASERDQSPNIMIRVGQEPSPDPSVNNEFGVITEDINDDYSSIYMVSDQFVDLKYSTLKHPEHLKSIDDFPPKLLGNQIIINSDRIFMNAKKNKIAGFSHKGIHWTTNRDYTTDVERDKRTWVLRDELSDVQRDRFTFVGRDHRSRVWNNSSFHIGNLYRVDAVNRITLHSPLIFVGPDGDRDQPIPLGQLLADFLEKFLDAHLKNAPKHVITMTGPGVLNPQIVKALLKLKTDVAQGALASFNSRYVYSGLNPPHNIPKPPRIST